ncbi:MAG: crosslink repair DNA glycosylase YcaQ family protein, partial [Clostridia bacterium]
MTIHVSRMQACRFLLTKHGLLGARRFSGAQGVLDYVRQVRCLQYDPVDVCGKSHELALLARVEGFTRELLAELLYGRRALIDFFDKNMGILPVEDWPYLEPVRDRYRDRSRSRDEVEQIAPLIRQTLHERGCATSQELNIKGRADWYWSETTLSRAALETLYFRGELVVHHKKNAVKSYALASDCLPHELLSAPCPLCTERERHVWQALRRIGAVGLLGSGSSDAWLGMDGFRAKERAEVFEALLASAAIVPVAVEGLAKPLYLRAEDEAQLLAAHSCANRTKYVRLLPPLDCMLWDRKLIASLFDFQYKWEIYTPEAQRKYSYYVLPVLYGERFAGRIE